MSCNCSPSNTTVPKPTPPKMTIEAAPHGGFTVCNAGGKGQYNAMNDTYGPALMFAGDMRATLKFIGDQMDLAV